jgi:DNA-binding XRE family transcriptional regulator
MKKNKGISLEKILQRELKNQAIKILFDERRFYLQMARLISDLRMKSGMTQSELAKSANVSQPLIARLERGDQNRTPTFETIYKILRVLGYKMEINVLPLKNKAA